MQDFSILIGGQAGDGIRQIGGLVAGLLGRLGYHVFFWDDYPSLIRGGHNFSLIRACRCMIQANTSDVDLIVALNEDTVKNHSWRLKEGATVVYDADANTTAPVQPQIAPPGPVSRWCPDGRHVLIGSYRVLRLHAPFPEAQESGKSNTHAPGPPR